MINTNLNWWWFAPEPPMLVEVDRGWWRRLDLQESVRHIWCYKTMCQANSKKIIKPAFLHFLKGHVAAAVSDDEIECQVLRLEIDVATVGSACASQSNWNPGTSCVSTRQERQQTINNIILVATFPYYFLVESLHLVNFYVPPRKLTWQWKITMFPYF